MVKVTKMRNAFIHPKTLSFKQLDFDLVAQFLVFILDL